MKWAGFAASAVFAAPCVDTRGDRASVAISGCLCLCNHHCSLVELLRQFFQGAIAALILQEPPRPPALCFRDLDSLGASFPMRECTSQIEYHGCSTHVGQ
jgi:hypothetical protein